MTDNTKISKVEQAKRLLECWERELIFAQVPRISWTVDRKAFGSVIHGPNRDSVVEFTYGYPSSWLNGYTYIIEGEGTYGMHQAPAVRRQLGNAVLVSGIGYAVTQNPDISFPTGRYIDFKMLTNRLINGRDPESDIVAELAEPHYLYIAEVSAFTIGRSERSESAKIVVISRFDDLLRRRKDTQKVTIMSFAVSCDYINKNVDMGSEISDLLSLSSRYGTMIDSNNRIVKIVTSPIRAGGIDGRV